MNEQLWWYVARASGLASWALCAASVLWGMALATRALGNRPRAPWLLDLHRYLGGLSVIFLGVHLGGLVLDGYVSFGLTDLLVPFASAWQPAAVAWGIVAMYLLLAVELTSLLQTHVPKRWWHGIHLSSYAVFVLGTVHLLTAGTDAANPVVRLLVLLVVGIQVFFLTYRRLAPRRRSGGAGAAAARAALAARATAPASAGAEVVEAAPVPVAASPAARPVVGEPVLIDAAPGEATVSGG